MPFFKPRKSHGFIYNNMEIKKSIRTLYKDSLDNDENKHESQNRNLHNEALC